MEAVLEAGGVCLVIFVASVTVVYLVNLFGMKRPSYDEIVNKKRQELFAELDAQSTATKSKKEQKKREKKERQHHTGGGGGSSGKGSVVAKVAPHVASGATNATPEHVGFKEHPQVMLIAGDDDDDESGVGAGALQSRRFTSAATTATKKPAKPILVHRESCGESSAAEDDVGAGGEGDIAASKRKRTVRSNSFKDIMPKDEVELKHSHHVSKKDRVKSNRSTGTYGEEEPRRVAAGSAKSDGKKTDEKRAVSEESSGADTTPPPTGAKKKSLSPPVAVPAPGTTAAVRSDVADGSSTTVAAAAEAVVLTAAAPAAPSAAGVAAAVPAVVNLSRGATPVSSDGGSGATPTTPTKSHHHRKKKDASRQHLSNGHSQELEIGRLLKLLEATDPPPPLTEEEIQRAVDALLNLQQQPNSWKLGSGRPDPMSFIKRQLSDTEQLLEAERSQVKAAHARIAELRKEVDMEKTRASQTSRALESLLTKHKEETDRLQAVELNLQQRVKDLTEEVMVARNRYLASEGHVTELKKSLTALDSQTADIAGMEAQVSAIKKENRQLQDQLEQRDVAVKRLETECFKYAEEARRLTDVCENMQREKVAECERLSAKLAELSAEKRRLEAQLAESMDCVGRTTKDAETKTQTLRAELEAAKNELNRVAKTDAANMAELKSRLATLDGVVKERDELLAVKKSLEEQLERARSSTQSNEGESSKRLSQLQQELEAAKAKNNDLRDKNYKVMEALNASEARLKQYESQLDRERTDERRVLVAALNDQSEGASPADVITNSHADWMRDFAAQLRRQVARKRQPSANNAQQLEEMETLKSKNESLLKELSGVKARLAVSESKSATLPSPAPSASSSPSIVVTSSATDDDVIRLQAEVDNYKRILDETELILHELQESVAREERSWLEREQAHLADKQQWSRDRQHMDELQENLSEMQSKLLELQAKLQEEESGKRNIEQKFEQTKSQLERKVRELESRVSPGVHTNGKSSASAPVILEHQEDEDSESLGESGIGDVTPTRAVAPPPPTSSASPAPANGDKSLEEEFCDRNSASVTTNKQPQKGGKKKKIRIKFWKKNKKDKSATST